MYYKGQDITFFLLNGKNIHGKIHGLAKSRMIPFLLPE